MYSRALLERKRSGRPQMSPRNMLPGSRDMKGLRATSQLRCHITLRSLYLSRACIVTSPFWICVNPSLFHYSLFRRFYRADRLLWDIYIYIRYRSAEFPRLISTTLGSEEEERKWKSDAVYESYLEISMDGNLIFFSLSSRASLFHPVKLSRPLFNRGSNENKAG